MSETTSTRRVLHLLVGNLSPSLIQEMAALSVPEAQVDIFQLTEANAREALENIFAADTVMVWGNI